MDEYAVRFTDTFIANLRRYASYHRQTQRRVERILGDLYHNTELLADATDGVNLKGCRSACLDRNFRIVFVICEECQRVEGFYSGGNSKRTQTVCQRESNAKMGYCRA